MTISDLPEWRKVDTIEEFVSAVSDTLTYWLMCHTDPETWADQWCAGEPAWMFEQSSGELSNDYFHFDWKRAAYEVLASQLYAERCSACGAIMVDYEGVWCECLADYEDDPDEFGEEPTTETVDDSELVEWLEEVGYPLSEWAIEQALEEKGFAAYSEALAGYISGHVEEMEEAVKRLDDAIAADDRWNMLTLAREATRIYHVNGEVMEDYGENIGLDFSLVDSVRNDGFAEVFGREEVREFLAA